MFDSVRFDRGGVWQGWGLAKCICGHHIHHSYMEEEQVKEIENSILDRCTPHGGVVHILVDRKSTYVSGIVRSNESNPMCARTA